MRKEIGFILLIFVCLGYVSCSNKARYEQMVKDGLNSGVRHDTLFLGLSLGMSSQDFYTQCWELNKQGIVRQGSGNTSVHYEMRDELKDDIDVNFYPNFYEDKIYEMPVSFKYKGWAPWNKQFSSDTLQNELVDLFQDWYGEGFMTVEDERRGNAYVKVDGNRRISLYKDSGKDGLVWALFTDMSVDDEAQAKIKEGLEK